MVAGGLLIAVRSNVFLAAGAPPTWNQRAWVNLLEVPGERALSHRTAASLHRAGSIVTSDIDVLVREDGWHPPVEAERHRTTWLPGHHLTTIDGLPVTSLPRTLFDLASLVSRKRHLRGLPTLTQPQVERAIDDAIARHKITIAELHAVLGALGGRGRPGTALMRQLVEARGEGYVATESELEDLLSDILCAHGLPMPERQRPLGDELHLVGRVDFVYPAQRVVIEADGRRHHTALMDADRDRWRDLELTASGFVVLRVTWHQLVHEPERFVAALRRVLASRPDLGATGA